MTIATAPRANRRPALMHFAAALALPLVAPAVPAAMTFEYTWTHSVNGTVVRSNPPHDFNGEAGFISELISDDFHSPNAGPGSAHSTVEARGVVLPRTREFGVGARATAGITPWDPNTDTAEIANPEVTAHISFYDTSVVFTPSLGLLAPVAIKVQPVLFSGQMSVPDPNAGLAIGNASLRIFLSVEEISINSVPVLYPDPAFEKTLPEGDTISFNGSQFASESLFPVITVRNGRGVRILFDMFVSAGVIPSVLPAENPPQAVAVSDFGSTVVWQGIEGFYDEQGNRLLDVQMSSESGFDWVTVGTVPLPPSGLSMLGGLALLGLWRTRRPPNT
ncbi:MAG: hypothetical protein K2Y51_18175 [Gammaproteobacteria bacterium]|nr:hypothetical protein [Gammaproteobacteria bacterium]